MRGLRVPAGLIGAAVLAVGLGGCVEIPEGLRSTVAESKPKSSAVGCPAVAAFPTTKERFAAADAVVTTSAVTPDGTRDRRGLDESAYRVEIVTVTKGALRAGTTVTVISTSDACTGGEPYPGGDLLAQPGPLRLYLFGPKHGWSTLNSADGVERVAG